MQQQGRICITADGNIEPLMLTCDFHAKELQIMGSSDGWDYHKHATWYFQKGQEHASYLEQLFELHITRDALISTFERLATGDMWPVKVLVSYSD